MEEGREGGRLFMLVFALFLMSSLIPTQHSGDRMEAGN